MALSEHPGLVVSSATHAALLLAALVSFSQTPKFTDADETVPVEMVSDQQFNLIMKGEKTAQKIQPTPKVDKVAEVSEPKPLPPVAAAKRDVPTPPPPLKRQADPGEDDKPAAPPVHAAVTPPPRPVAEPPKPAVKPVAAKPPPVAQKPPPPEDAEAIEPKPVPRPKPQHEAKQEAKVVPKPRPVDRPKDPPKKIEPQFKLDQVAKLLEEDKQKDPPRKTEKPASKPKSGDETAVQHRFDLGSISKLLSKEAPQRKASSGHQLQQVASLGAPNASAAKMSPSMWAELDGLLQDQYRQCWSYFGLAAHQKYVPEIHVQYALNGALTGQPALMNPPSDPNLRSLADSALRAVRRCDPLRIPAQFQPFYEQWKGRVVRFDPETML